MKVTRKMRLPIYQDGAYDGNQAGAKGPAKQEEGMWSKKNS